MNERLYFRAERTETIWGEDGNAFPSQILLDGVPVLRPGTTWLSCRLSADPGIRRDYVKTPSGAPALALAENSPLRKKARKIWFGSDGFLYCQDNSGNWRILKNPGDGKNAFQTLAAADAAALGLDAENPVIPDATGRERYPKPSPGPLDFAHAATRFYVR